MVTIVGPGRVILVASQLGNAAYEAASSVGQELVVIGIPPRIDIAPVGGSIIVGSSFSFSVGASGSSPLMYQWRKSGVVISEATNATFVISSAGGCKCNRRIWWQRQGSPRLMLVDADLRDAQRETGGLGPPVWSNCTMVAKDLQPGTRYEGRLIKRHYLTNL